MRYRTYMDCVLHRHRWIRLWCKNETFPVRETCIPDLLSPRIIYVVSRRS